MRHFEEAKAMWANLVPKSGQADTQQGELLRAVEKLRDEALRNGNVNWDDGHRHFVRYLRETLTAADCFTDAERRGIDADLDEVGVEDSPPIEDAPYDRLADRVVEWARAHPEPIPHEHLPDLHR